MKVVNDANNATIIDDIFIHIITIFHQIQAYFFVTRFSHCKFYFSPKNIAINSQNKNDITFYASDYSAD